MNERLKERLEKRLVGLYKALKGCQARGWWDLVRDLLEKFWAVKAELGALV